MVIEKFKDGSGKVARDDTFEVDKGSKDLVGSILKVVAPFIVGFIDHRVGKGG